MTHVNRPPGEPELVTAPELVPVLQELASLEPIFHQPALGATRAELERAMVDDFWETGASGRRYSRPFVLDVLDRRRATPEAERWKTSDLYLRRLASDLYLYTYTLVQDNNRISRRATIWQQAADGWKIVYHQGTLVEDASGASAHRNT